MFVLACWWLAWPANIGNLVLYGGCVWVGWGAECLPTWMFVLAGWWLANGFRQPCVSRKGSLPRGIRCSTKKYWASCCKDFKIHDLPNDRSACSVAASYKPPMLVTRVRLPACAYFPCACCSCGVVLVLIPRITAAVDHESQHALDPNQPHQETDIDIRFALHYHLWSPPGTLSTHGLVAMTSA